MARQLLNYANFGTTFPAAYLAITKPEVDKLIPRVRVRCHIWASKDARVAGATPLQEVVFDFVTDLNAPAGAAFAPLVEATPAAGIDGTIPTQSFDITMATLYTAILEHPDGAALFAGSTPI